MSDRTLKSENDTREREGEREREADLTNCLHQSVTKAQRNSNTGLLCPHDCFRQKNQSFRVSLERKEAKIQTLGERVIIKFLMQVQCIESEA